jgi:predicted MFS family arabinose efflux permease
MTTVEEGSPGAPAIPGPAGVAEAAASAESAESAESATARIPPAIRERQFVSYLVGQSVSQLGNMVWFVALSWTAVQLGSAGTASVLMVLSSLPTIAFTLFGGVIVDRYDVRRLMLGSDALRTVVTLIAAGLALSRPGIPLLAVLALVFGTVNAVFQPAAGAMQPRLLRPEQYSGGATLSTVAARLALSLGGPLGGLAVAYGGLPLGLFLDAATFAVSVATLYTVRPRPNPNPQAEAGRTDFIGEFRAGFSFLCHHRVLGPLCATFLLMELGFIGPMNVGLAALSKERGWGAHGIGLMLTGFGLGAVAGAVLTNRLRIRRHVGTWIAVTAALMGTALYGNALAPNLPAAVAAAAMVGVFSGPSNILGTVLIQTETPDALRGRINSFQTLLSLGTTPLAMLGTGFATTAFGARDTYAICAAIEACSLATLLSPAFRRARIAQD